MKYRDWLCKWLALYVKPTAKERTYEKYRAQINNHLIPALCTYELCDLSAYILQKFTAELIESGYATSTMKAFRRK